MKVYVIGDSISLHYGPYLRDYLRGFMEYDRKGGSDETPRDIEAPRDHGANGGDSSMVLAFLRRQALAGGIDADLLLLNCGLHDIKVKPSGGRRQVGREQYRDNLRAILETVEGMRPRPVWVRTTPCDENIHNSRNRDFHRFSGDCRAYNRIADEVMAAAGVPSIDLYTFTANQGNVLYCDHVHFYHGIRRQQAAFIAGWLLALVNTGRYCE